MELIQLIRVINNIKTREINSITNINNSVDEIMASSDEINIENAIVGSLFMEDLESFHILCFIIDYANFLSEENKIVFDMIREIYAYSDEMSYENLINELTKNGLLNEKIQIHLAMLRQTFLDKELRKALSEKTYHTIIYLAPEN